MPYLLPYTICGLPVLITSDDGTPYEPSRAFVYHSGYLLIMMKAQEAWPEGTRYLDEARYDAEMRGRDRLGFAVSANTPAVPDPQLRLAPPVLYSSVFAGEDFMRRRRLFWGKAAALAWIAGMRALPIPIADADVPEAVMEDLEARAGDRVPALLTAAAADRADPYQPPPPAAAAPQGEEQRETKRPRAARGWVRALG